MVCTEQLLGSINRQLFDDIDKLAASIVAAAWISLGIFIRHHRALGFQHSFTHRVLRRDEFQIIFEPLRLLLDSCKDFWVA